MKAMKFLLAVLLLSGCALFPDSISIGTRTDEKFRTDGYTLNFSYNNPWKPRKVHEEYISAEGGFYGGDAP